MGPAAALTAAEVWLLTGNRAGEVGQQRAVGAALGLPLRELAVARMAASDKAVAYDFGALRPPWPRLVVSFGKTLAAALHMRAAGAPSRWVHLGLPRKLAVGVPDLIVPMPTDRYVDAPNVLRVRMPLNPAPGIAAAAAPVVAPIVARLAGLPRPWTALIIGGDTARAPLDPRDVAQLAARADARVRAHGGSLLVTTSPRTPASALPALRRALTAPGELHVYRRGDAGNPYGAYLALADELVVSADSASMIAECWRSGKPLWVALPRPVLRRRIARGLRAAVPRSLVASGLVAGDVDIERWVRRLADAGDVGLFGVSDPVRRYRADDDDDLRRVVARIRALLRDDA